MTTVDSGLDAWLSRAEDRMWLLISIAGCIMLQISCERSIYLHANTGGTDECT